ncbi:MAG: hypothetical protein CMN58_06380 [Solibacterales bacterium]|nr:hypothetical protein [Bryobacterales bacterium]|tara:strand:+ start:192966 stop:195806 length:2841 start_codon:yes stop_codon:yes gene_type:complete
MRFFRLAISRCFLLLGTVLSGVSLEATQKGDGEHFFETKIRPLLIERCSSCHGEKVQMAGLDLTTEVGFKKGASGQPVFLAGHPETSSLIRAVRYEDSIKMPPTGKLPESAIAALTRWIEMGAPWPDTAKRSFGDTGDQGAVDPTKTNHWSFQPIRDPQLPTVANTSWIKTDVDAFILAQIEKKGLQPVRPADKLTLLRRVTLDLLGLLPTPEEIKYFLNDNSSRAYADLVERLLNSQHYGERWGRHWLDVARYADSTGVDEDKPYIHAWRYRDYVIEAFNADLPYDRFVSEQVAGDLLPPLPGHDINTKGITATGFLALGPMALAQQDKVQMVYDVVDEQIDTMSKTFLALTISCSRCHDHKFDPILTTDYYSLASIFASTRSYVNPKQDGTSFVVTPLIRKDLGERYLEEQKKIRGGKRAVSTVLRIGIIDYKLRKMAPLIADYMLAARRVYEDGVTIENVTQEAKLEPEELQEWVDYLQPSDIPRAHLDDWHMAGAAERDRVAKRYEQLYISVAQARMKKMNAWIDENLEKLMNGERQTRRIEPLRRSPFHTEVDGVSPYTLEAGPLAISEKKREELLSSKFRKRVRAVQARLKRVEMDALSQPPLACAVTEGDSIRQPVFIRGRHDNHGPIVPKQFPVVLAGHDQKPVRKGSGRLELAKFLISTGNPLTARVMANRIWLGHFGEGLVRTPNNFGRTGEPPTHPDLLDYLARRFMDSGWSIKHMHRLILLSNTYQMSSNVSDVSWSVDPSNRLWSHFSRRRLTLEELRDNYLGLAGNLNLTVGGNIEPNASKYTEFQRNNRRVNPDLNNRRSVYLPLHRNKLPTVLSLFNFGDATTSNGKRNQTNIAPQALYLMNSGFANECADKFADQLLRKGSIEKTEDELIKRAYSMALSRYPDHDENRMAIHYLQSFREKQTSDGNARKAAWRSFCKMLMTSNEFHYVD